MLHRQLYRTLLRSANQLAKAQRKAPRAALVYRGSVNPTLTPTGAAHLQSVVAKWQSQMVPASLNQCTTTPIHKMHATIKTLIRTGFEGPTQTMLDDHDAIAQAIQAVRDMKQSTRDLISSRAWHIFANASVTTEHTTVLDAATRDGGMCKVEHIVNAHLVEYGLSMIAELRMNNARSSKDILQRSRLSKKVTIICSWYTRITQLYNN